MEAFAAMKPAKTKMTRRNAEEPTAEEPSAAKPTAEEPGKWVRHGKLEGVKQVESTGKVLPPLHLWSAASL